MLIYLPRSRQSAWHNMHKARIAACLTQRFRPLLECILKGCLSLPVRIWNMFSLSLQTTFPWFCIFFSEHFLKIWWWWNSKVIGLIEVCSGVVEIFLSRWCWKTRIWIESQYFFEGYIQDSRIYKTGYFNVSSLICWPPLPLILWRLPNHYFSPFQSSVVGCRSGRWSKMIHHHQLPGLPRLAGNGPARVLPTDWWWWWGWGRGTPNQPKWTSQKRSKFKCADIFKGYSRVYLVRLCEIGAGDKIYTPLCWILTIL